MGPRGSGPDPESEGREGNEGWTTDFPDDTDAVAKGAHELCVLRFQRCGGS